MAETPGVILINWTRDGDPEAATELSKRNGERQPGEPSECSSGLAEQRGHAADMER